MSTSGHRPARRAGRAWATGLHGWRAGTAAGLVAALTLSGCETAPVAGRSLVSEELSRVRSNALFRVEEVDHSRAYVVADGQRVVLSPVQGLCLTGEAIDLTESGVFAVVADCVTETPLEATGVAGDAGEIYRLPPPFPGLMTLSVSAQPMFDGPTGREAALDRMQTFLETGAGLALLGRTGSGESVEVVDARRLGDALYVHVHDRDPGRLPLMSADFWRAFVEIEGRLILVTVSGFRDQPLSDDVMLAVLAAQVAELREANGAPLVRGEIELAASVESFLGGYAPEIEVAEGLAPPSSGRRQLGGPGGQAEVAGFGTVRVAEPATGTAPGRAPLAPQRR